LVRKQKAVILLTVLVDIIGFGIVIPILPYYVESFGAGAITVTAIFSSFSFFSFLSGPFLGALSDRIGRRPVLLLSILSTAIGWFVVAGAGALWVVFLGRIIDGIAAGNISIAQTYLVDIARDEKERTTNLGLFGATFGVGFLLGPILGGILSSVSPAFPFYCAGGLALINAGLAYRLLPETLTQPRMEAMEFNPFKPLIRAATTADIRRNMVAWTLFGLSFVTTQSVFALFVRDVFGFSGLQTGFAFALLGILALVNQSLLLPRLWLKRFTNVQLQTLMPLLLAIGLLSMATDSLAVFLVGLVLLGTGQGVFRVVLTSIVAGKSPPQTKGEIIGVLSGVFSACNIVAPLIAGPLYELNHHIPYIVGSVLMFLAFVLSLQCAGKDEATRQGVALPCP
jgi:DHA1 family tetracycline resistance protein-like MFS transporter